MYDVIVIGGGPAGVTAALRAKELGANVALVERGRLGGTCTNDGCAPTRVLAKAARLVRDSDQFAEYALTGERPSVNLPDLLARTQQTIYRLQEKKQLIDHLSSAGIAVLADSGPARFVDPHTIALSGSQQLQAGKFILCVGGHARRINFPGSDLALTHSDVWTLDRLPRSLAIVGAAATGCQLASIFAAFGARVHLLEMAPRILPGEDEAVSKTVGECFAERGLDLITGIGGVEAIEQSGNGLTLLYNIKHPERSGGRHPSPTRQNNTGAPLRTPPAAQSKGAPGDSERYSLSVDSVILAVGWVGNIESLNLEAAGVQAERGYIVVDDTLRTSAPHIFAAGDVTGRMMLVQSASHDARVAAENAALGANRTFHHFVVPHGGFTDPEYGSVGLTEAQARALEPDCAAATVPYADTDRAVIDGRTEGFCKLIVSRQSRLLLGAHVVGEQAVEVVQIAAAGMAAGMRIEQLAELELAYPTFTAIIGLAARQLVRSLGLTPLAQEWRTLNRISERMAEWERMD